MNYFLQNQKGFYFFALGLTVLLLHPENCCDYYYTYWLIYRKYSGCLKTWSLQSKLGSELGTLQSCWVWEGPCLKTRASFLSHLFSMGWLPGSAVWMRAITCFHQISDLGHTVVHTCSSV